MEDSTGTRTLDHDFQVLHAVFFGDLTSTLSSYLGSNGGWTYGNHGNQNHQR